MKIAIRYFTKSKKGNTVKLANFISAKTNLPALDVTNNLEEEVDQLILVNAMYAADVDVEEYYEKYVDFERVSKHN